MPVSTTLSRPLRVVAYLCVVKYTSEGEISVQCRAFEEPLGVQASDNIAIELVVADTGCGITSDKLESIFREFEQVESTSPRTHSPGLGMLIPFTVLVVSR